MMKFEDLDCWKEARGLVIDVYSLTRTGSLSKDFGLRDQIQRAAVSVMTNIAEGFERTGNAEKLHFYNIARASCGEVRSLLYVIEDNHSDAAQKAVTMRGNSIKIGSLLSGLIASTRRRNISKNAGLILTILVPISFLLFFLGGRRLEIGDWRLKIGDWMLIPSSAAQAASHLPSSAAQAASHLPSSAAKAASHLPSSAAQAASHLRL